MNHPFLSSKLIILSALGVLCCANLGYAAWTYSSGDVTAEQQVNVTVGTFSYITKPGWYDYTNGNKNSYTLKSELGFIIRGATYQENSSGQLVLSAFPEDAEQGLVIDSLINYESCPVVFLPKQISLTDAKGNTVTHDVVSYDPECGLSRNNRGKKSLFFDLKRDGNQYTTPGTNSSGNKIKTLNVKDKWITVYPYNNATPSKTNITLETHGDSLEYLSFYEPQTTSNITLQYIGTRAFGYLENVATINLSGCNNLLWIDEWAFTTSPKLTSFSLPSAYRVDNSQIASVLGGLTTKVATTYFGYPSNSESKGNLYGCLQLCTALPSFDFTLYPNITNLPRAMFRDDYSLSSITLSTALSTNDVHLASNQNESMGDCSFGAYFYDMGCSQTTVINSDPFNNLGTNLKKLYLTYQGTSAEWPTLFQTLTNKRFLRYRTIDTLTTTGSFSGYVSCKGTTDSTTSDGYAHLSVAISNN